MGYVKAIFAFLPCVRSTRLREAGWAGGHPACAYRARVQGQARRPAAVKPGMRVSAASVFRLYRLYMTYVISSLFHAWNNHTSGLKRQRAAHHCLEAFADQRVGRSA
jgi:succinylarginine dihydrolase